MLFKFINTSVTYQQIINNTFKNLFNVTVVAYLNDILIYLENFAKHCERVSFRDNFGEQQMIDEDIITKFMRSASTVKVCINLNK